MEDVDLKYLERKAFRTTFQDGFWDIFMGMLLLAMAVFAWLTDTNLPTWVQYLLFISMQGVALIVLMTGKKYITVPRIGHVKFGSAGQTRQKKTRWLLALSVTIGGLLFIVGLPVGIRFLDWIQSGLVFPVVWAANMLIILSLIAYFLSYNRLYLIGLLYAVCLPLDAVLKKLADIYFPALAFGVPAVIILAMGAVVFHRFLRENPLPEMEV